MPQRIGKVKALFTTPGGLRRALNAWPPFVASRISVRHIADDWRRVLVVLKKSPLSSNYFGTQFGGSMFSMVDPFFVIMLVHNLGPDYVVWDAKGEIDFLAPGLTDLQAELIVTEGDLEAIRRAAEGGEKVLRWFSVDLRDSDGKTVARVRKEIYVRRRSQSE